MFNLDKQFVNTIFFDDDTHPLPSRIELKRFEQGHSFLLS
jgi:hypothetical protein